MTSYYKEWCDLLSGLVSRLIVGNSVAFFYVSICNSKMATVSQELTACLSNTANDLNYYACVFESGIVEITDGGQTCTILCENPASPSAACCASYDKLEACQATSAERCKQTIDAIFGDALECCRFLSTCQTLVLIRL